MDNFLQIGLPIFLILIFYAFILTRKGERQRTKYILGSSRDWITYITIALGASAMIEGILDLGIKIPVIWSISGFVILFIVMFIGVILRYRAGKPIIRPVGDERINAIKAKSARNAFFATYVVFFVIPFIKKSYTLDATWYVVTLAVGLVVFFASYFFYYYREA
jgi:hypothetical protein